MKIYDVLTNLINHNYYEKEDMTNKLNVFYTFNQITIEEYTELMAKINPATKEEVEKQEDAEDTTEEVVTQ